MEGDAKPIQEYVPAELELTARVRTLNGRKAIVGCTVRANGEVCVTGEVTAIRVAPEA